MGGDFVPHVLKPPPSLAAAGELPRDAQPRHRAVRSDTADGLSSRPARGATIMYRCSVQPCIMPYSCHESSSGCCSRSELVVPADGSGPLLQSPTSRAGSQHASPGSSLNTRFSAADLGGHLRPGPHDHRRVRRQRRGPDVPQQRLLPRPVHVHRGSHGVPGRAHVPQARTASPPS